MNRGNWRVGVFVCSNPDLGKREIEHSFVLHPLTSLAPRKKLDRARNNNSDDYTAREIFHNFVNCKIVQNVARTLYCQ